MFDQNKNQDNRNNKDGKPDDSGSKKPKFNLYWVYGIIALAFIGIQIFGTGSQPVEINFQQFEREMLRNHDVEKIEIVNREKARIYIKQERLDLPRHEGLFDRGLSSASRSGPHYFFTIGSVELFEDRLREAQEEFAQDQVVSVNYVTERDYFSDVLSWLLPIFILVAIWLFIFRRMSGAAGGGGPGGIFNVGKSKAKMFDRESNVKTDFKDVAGLEEAKMEVMEVVDFLKTPQKYTQLGGKIPKGVLLVGPPGTGKTLLAKAVAGEANVPFFSISGSDFVEMFVGVGASRVRDLFKQAKDKAPCIVFIDEIDAVGRARGKNPGFGANDERENTLNQLLTEMDGFEPNLGVILLAATNRADVLDRALLRAGRFDRQIHVELPDLNERLEIFEVHLRTVKLEEDFDISFLAKQTPGFSGADIANVCNEAALIAARRNKNSVGKQDFLDAIDRIIGGLERKNKIISMEEKRTIAYHEAGHATLSWLLEHANPLVKVTIIPRGRTLGAAWYLPEERQITTTEQLNDEMCVALGGRASEEINFKKVSTGALNDLERVTKQAYAMVTYFGMSKKIGNISYYDSSGQNEYTFSKPYSDTTAELIDKEVKDILDKAYKRAKDLLTRNRDGLSRLADLLLEKEVIFSEDLEKIFGKRKFKKPEKEPMIRQQPSNNNEGAAGKSTPGTGEPEKEKPDGKSDKSLQKEGGSQEDPGKTIDAARDIDDIPDRERA
ncbi:MAG: ATP-dependent metallopeptidase FtsH/Yme1/Tma family protein [Marinilabiliales bacterium]|nr:MAG: ATP-dependent metallopeptidase FtsH/Yme1/Tma family protein [Marinilabiliales bacterium]